MNNKRGNIFVGWGGDFIISSIHFGRSRPEIISWYV